MKIQQIILLNQILQSISSKDLGKEINYGVARNLLKIKPILKEFDEQNTLRINCFCRKDGKGENIIKDNLYDFGENQKTADEKYTELLERETAFDPYKIRRSDQTDSLPAALLAELLDVIITEEPIKQ